ncbi:hypothetical protein RYX36_036278 [Vicia faba]
MVFGNSPHLLEAWHQKTELTVVEELKFHLIHSRTCKMPKERKDRSVSQDSSRTSPYPSSSSRVRRSTSKTPLESEENIKEWEEARTCKMPKERKDRSVSQDSSRTSPYPSSSSRVRRSTSKTPLESEENIKEWEEARCPVCIPSQCSPSHMFIP